MTNHTAWIVDDDLFWQEIVATHLGRIPEITSIRRFDKVDLALQELDTLPREEWPDFVSTDGDTKSQHTGVDLAERLKGTGVGVIVLSGNKSKVKHLADRDCGSAQFIQKEKLPTTDYHEVMERAIEAAKVEKRLGADNMPGQGSGKGR